MNLENIQEQANQGMDMRYEVAEMIALIQRQEQELIEAREHRSEPSALRVAVVDERSSVAQISPEAIVAAVHAASATGRVALTVMGADGIERPTNVAECFVRRLMTPSAGAVGPTRDVCAEMRALCSACGGTGDVTSIDGEWRGSCDCDASKAPSEGQELPALPMPQDSERAQFDAIFDFSAFQYDARKFGTEAAVFEFWKSLKIGAEK